MSNSIRIRQAFGSWPLTLVIAERRQSWVAVRARY